MEQLSLIFLGIYQKLASMDAALWYMVAMTSVVWGLFLIGLTTFLLKLYREKKVSRDDEKLLERLKRLGLLGR